MTPRNTQERIGFTLVELLVVMSILVALAALALVLLPTFSNNTRTLAGTAEVQATLRNAQAMAASARLPRGVRLIVPPGGTMCQELQYLEIPPVMIANPQVLVANTIYDPSDPTGTNTPNGPRVEFAYEFAGPPKTMSDPPQGSIVNRHCYIYGLNSDQRDQVGIGSTLVLPTLGVWSRLLKNPSNPGFAWSVANTTPQSLEVILDVYPDAILGAGSAPPPSSGTVWPSLYRTYHFGVYGPPVPLLGEPTVALPKDVAIDLAVSSPVGSTGLSYDILFAPSGQTITTYGTIISTGMTANTGIYLWVRDIAKVPSMNQSGVALYQAFQAGGEQQIVGIRNGYVGTAPVAWPDPSGTYPTVYGPFQLAQDKLD